jgi:hypothetical protein
MNTLRQAIHEYLSMRRSLGFKLKEAGNYPALLPAWVDVTAWVNSGS